MDSSNSVAWLRNEVKKLIREVRASLKERARQQDG